MYSSNFEYFRPTTTAEAIELLRAHPGAKLLAGGHSLLPQMKLRVAQPAALVDIGRLSDLSGISLDGDTVRIARPPVGEPDVCAPGEFICGIDRGRRVEETRRYRA